MDSLENKRILVSGGASGIGRATAAVLSARGARVAVIDRAAATGVPAEIALKADLSQEAEVAAAVEQAGKTLGGIDGLVHSAGIAGLGTAVDLELDRWDQVLAVHLTGAMLLARHAIPAMLDAGGGAIVNVASIYGMVGGSNNLAYNSAKGAIVQLTRSIAADYGRQGIRANSVSPGYIETPLSDLLKQDRRMLEAFVDMHVLGRGGQPEEVAAAIAFLLSDEASFITAVNLPVDGGFTGARVMPGFSSAVQDRN
ncbi:MAG: SDR family oxidoreductase [Novosphingobium sp.]